MGNAEIVALLETGDRADAAKALRFYLADAEQQLLAAVSASAPRNARV